MAFPMLTRGVITGVRAEVPRTIGRATATAGALQQWRRPKESTAIDSMGVQCRTLSSSLLSYPSSLVAVSQGLVEKRESFWRVSLGAAKKHSLASVLLHPSNYHIPKCGYAKKSRLASLLEEDHEPIEVGVPPSLKKGDVALVGTEGELISQCISYKDVLSRAQEELLTIKVVDESGEKMGRPVVRYYTTEQLRNQEQAQQDRLELDKQTKKKEKIKELRFSSVIAEGDVLTKIDRVESFLLKGYKVRICVVFKKVWTFDEPLAHDILHNVLDRVKPLGELVPNSISTARGTLFGMIQPNQGEIDKYIANGYTLEPEDEDDGDK